MAVSARPIQQQDIPFLIDYWLSADESFLKSMGADIQKIPPREAWANMLTEQVNTKLTEKKSYCIIWLNDGQPIGHSNASDIIFGDEAHMHLHLWKNEFRKKGMGTALVKLTLPYFFNDLQLKTLYCEPYALNPAPNKILEKTGFHFIKEYTTVPGWLNFEQPVRMWKLTADEFKKLK
jgi:RimJ/RimL family protein N-acetyltransferase